MRLTWPVTLLAACLWSVAAYAEAPDLTAEAVDALARQTIARFDAPGVALAVVKDGQVVLTRGYGVGRAGAPGAVDEHTVFYTASVTKAFTVTALGLLADQGRLRIDDPVVKYLPEFAIADPDRGRSLTVRDLLSHRTGLPRADLLMVSGMAPAEVLPRLAALAPHSPLRSRFTYQNQMYLVLGLLLERLGGASWSTFVDERVLRPVGFVDGNAAGLGHWPAGATPAAPHARSDAGVAAIDLVPRAPSGAGGVNASAVDMAAWLRFQLGDGTVNGTRLATPAVLAAQQAPNVLTPGNLTMPSAVTTSYGLGWFVHDYFGQKIVQHGGNGEGWTSLVLMVPGARFGVAVLTNQHNSGVPSALAFSLVDRLLGRPARDWAAEFQAVERRLGPPASPAPGAEVSTDVPPDQTSLGEYDHPVYGRARLVQVEGGAIELHYGTLRGALAGTTVSWLRSDMRAVLGSSRVTTKDGGTRLVLDAGGERVEFTRVR